MVVNFSKNKQKVLVAMSGGVDSSVAAALLQEQGYDLIGATMNLACVSGSSERGCCSVSAANDAKRVADLLGFPHYVLNFKDEFKHRVIANFIEEYKSGRTPNPCIRCNQFMKFGLFEQKARELGCDLAATGHYARILREILNPKSEIRNNDQHSNYKLLKGKDLKKDQSYVLYMMGQEMLARTLFPLGDMTKDKVRKLAKKFDLPVYDKQESQEICFIPDDDYVRFLKDTCPEAVRPGEIQDLSGRVVGRHEGIAFYTLGQRKGIGHHQGEPKYVVRIDPAKNLIVIGDQKDTLGTSLIASQMSYVSGQIPSKPLKGAAKVRYNSPEAEALLEPLIENRAKVVFKNPQHAITPGQSMVFYSGDEVVGGGVIDQCL